MPRPVAAAPIVLKKPRRLILDFHEFYLSKLLELPIGGHPSVCAVRLEQPTEPREREVEAKYGYTVGRCPVEDAPTGG
jgi:hypothetical protein